MALTNACGAPFRTAGGRCAGGTFTDLSVSTHREAIPDFLSCDLYMAVPPIRASRRDSGRTRAGRPSTDQAPAPASPKQSLPHEPIERSDVPKNRLRQITRRHFFEQAGFGIGAAALGSLIGWAPASGLAGATRKAKSVIFLFMAGAPSQLDLLDHKPKLRQLHGHDAPDEIMAGERFAFIEGTPKLLGSPYSFRRWGESGAEISELLPHLGSIADRIAIVKSLHTTQFNHAPAQIFMNTGHPLVGRPSMGSWLSYGLGTENQDLPTFTVLLSGDSEPSGGKSCWGTGFLPTVHQGVEFRSQGDPVLFLSNPPGVSSERRRESLDSLRTLNRIGHARVGDRELTIADRTALWDTVEKRLVRLAFGVISENGVKRPIPLRCRIVSHRYSAAHCRLAHG